MISLFCLHIFWNVPYPTRGTFLEDKRTKKKKLLQKQKSPERKIKAHTQYVMYINTQRAPAMPVSRTDTWINQSHLLAKTCCITYVLTYLLGVFSVVYLFLIQAPKPVRAKHDEAAACSRLNPVHGYLRHRDQHTLFYSVRKKKKKSAIFVCLFVCLSVCFIAGRRCAYGGGGTIHVVTLTTTEKKRMLILQHSIVLMSTLRSWHHPTWRIVYIHSSAKFSTGGMTWT